MWNFINGEIGVSFDGLFFLKNYLLEIKIRSFNVIGFLDYVEKY